MPQEYQVLRCYNCETFQVDIVKKNNSKWQCKMCGEKQSTKKVFGTSSSGKECRELAQELNIRRGELLEQKLDRELEQQECDEYWQEDDEPAEYWEEEEEGFQEKQKMEAVNRTNSVPNNTAKRRSKWAIFLVKPEGQDEELQQEEEELQ